MIFDTIANTGHEQVVFCNSKDTGLKAIIAIHNTVLGPSLGGLRMWPYKNEAEAVNDVLRLSRGMTYKNAVAGLNIGGGKAVIIGDPAKDKSEALFRAFGRFVNSLNGRYITAEDVGIDVNDMEWVYRETEFVTGVHRCMAAPAIRRRSPRTARSRGCSPRCRSSSVTRTSASTAMRCRAPAMSAWSSSSCCASTVQKYT